MGNCRIKRTMPARIVRIFPESPVVRRYRSVCRFSMESPVSELQDINVLRKPPRVLVFASGKSGVGKSSLVANLAAAMAARGAAVCIIDADTGLSNTATLLGLRPAFGLETSGRRRKDLGGSDRQNPRRRGGIARCAKPAGDACGSRATRESGAVGAGVGKPVRLFFIDLPAVLTDKLLQFVEAAKYAFCWLAPIRLP